MAQFRSNIAYGLSQALLSEAPLPIQARRAPTGGDLGYLPGTIWINLSTNIGYILAGITANVAVWSEVTNSGGGSGSFSTLASTGATTLATTGASVNTIGNTTGATSLSMYAGTGNMLLDGAASTAIAIGTSLTTGTIAIGGTAQTGAITLGNSTGAQTINVGVGGTGIKTINIGTGAAANFITIGTTNTTSSATMVSGTGGASVTSTGGPVSLATTDNIADAILIYSNGGTAETIRLNCLQGTGSNSINITSVAGGVTIQTPAAKGLILSNGTQAPGIFVGTGSPNGSLSAPQGSLFLNVAGSSSSTRMFVNSNGTTAWVAVTTAT